MTRETIILQRAELSRVECVTPVEARTETGPMRAVAGRFEWTFFGLFTVLLALVTWRHEMWIDEAQAWLISRDSHSLPALFHALRYEGHPALWYLILYIPAHISANPVSMQVINFVIAAALAWVVLSAQELPRPIRALIIFSYFVFYQDGVIARNYELAMLLLVGAARCLTGKRQYRKLAILLLALSINAHVFAMPVAVALAAWAFYFAKLKTWKDAGRLLRDREFLAAVVVLTAGGILALLTVWPAKDLVAQESLMPTIGGDFLVSAGAVWLSFFPRLPGPVQIFLRPFHASIPATVVFSLALLAFVTLLLRTKAARIFFLACAFLEIALIALTVGRPFVHHLCFFFAALVIALMLDDRHGAASNTPPRWLSNRFASVALLVFFLIQVLCAADAAQLDWRRPYSGSKGVSLWLKANHLNHNPLVLEPSGETTGIVAYLELPNAYYPSCRCFGSYEVRNTRRRAHRMATASELKMVRGKSPLPVILISNQRLEPASAGSLGLVEIYASPKDVIEHWESFFVYEQLHPPA